MKINGAMMIAGERARHHGKGWTESHDMGHTDGMLAKVAASLAVKGTDATVVDPNYCVGGEFGDPWGLIEKHPDQIERLVIAGALIAAEIDRLRNERTMKVNLQSSKLLREARERVRSRFETQTSSWLMQPRDEEWWDTQRLLEADLAENLPDDDEPATDRWLEAGKNDCGFWLEPGGPEGSVNIEHPHPNIRGNSDMDVIIVFGDLVTLRNPTRGQLRRLLRAIDMLEGQ